MDISQLRTQLITDEGKRLYVYKDTLNHLTVGVGHLVLPVDHLKADDEISEEMCNLFLDNDIAKAQQACQSLFRGFSTYPEEAQQVLANMAFNLGQTKLGYFITLRLKAGVRDWLGVATAMEDSTWYHQVGNRAKRLVKRMKAVATTEKG